VFKFWGSWAGDNPRRLELIDDNIRQLGKFQATLQGKIEDLRLANALLLQRYHEMAEKAAKLEKLLAEVNSRPWV
jgi:hypothetical protein